MKLKRTLVQSVSLILLLTASIKGVEIFRSARYTGEMDWVFIYVFGGKFWTTGVIMTLGMAMEAITAGVLLFSNDLKLKSIILLMLCSSFTIYRLIHWIIGAPAVCPCLGHAGDWLKLSHGLISGFSIGSLVYMSLVGVFLFCTSESKSPRLSNETRLA